MTDKPLWHYTLARDSHLGAIRRSGRINPEQVEWALAPAVWLSTDQHFEPTACKGKFVGQTRVTCTVDEMLPVAARIGIRSDCPNLLRWRDFKTEATARFGASGHQKIGKQFRNMEKVARDQGADPINWYASFDPIPVEQWTRIETFADGRWIKVTP